MVWCLDMLDTSQTAVLWTGNTRQQGFFKLQISIKTPKPSQISETHNISTCKPFNQMLWLLHSFQFGKNDEIHIEEKQNKGKQKNC